jgi:hypothetical protein
VTQLYLALAFTSVCPQNLAPTARHLLPQNLAPTARRLLPQNLAPTARRLLTPPERNSCNSAWKGRRRGGGGGVNCQSGGCRLQGPTGQLHTCMKLTGWCGLCMKLRSDNLEQQAAREGIQPKP